MLAGAAILTPAVIAVAAWPVGIMVMVLGVLLLVPRGQQVAVLAGIAEVIRAARARTAIGPPASRAELSAWLTTPSATNKARRLVATSNPFFRATIPPVWRALSRVH